MSLALSTSFFQSTVLMAACMENCDVPVCATCLRFVPGQDSQHQWQGPTYDAMSLSRQAVLNLKAGYVQVESCVTSL